jgi:hypothetical protein
MEDALRAYELGRADGLGGRRDTSRAADPATGTDYRMGFLDARLEVYRMHAQARQFVEEAGEEPPA